MNFVENFEIELECEGRWLRALGAVGREGKC